MSVTYEDALQTLQSMFGEPWTKISLDAVLRHYKGHMENTVEAILKHGDKSPEELVQKLKRGDDKDEQSKLDQQLARSLAAQEERSQVKQTQSAPQSSAKQSRGTPIDLPAEFLRIPGYKGSGQSASQSIDQDEALARMLQDEFFSRELANNPEFAHLARAQGRGNPAAGPPRQPVQRSSAAHFTEPPKIMEKLSEMGIETKKKLQLLAAQWNTQWNNNAHKFGLGSTQTVAGGGGAVGVAVAGSNETRGLLDDDGDDEGEMMEMTFAGAKKTQ